MQPEGSLETLDFLLRSEISVCAILQERAVFISFSLGVGICCNSSWLHQILNMVLSGAAGVPPGGSLLHTRIEALSLAGCMAGEAYLTITSAQRGPRGLPGKYQGEQYHVYLLSPEDVHKR